MGKKHSFLKTILVTTGSLYAANKLIDYSAKGKNMCSSDRGYFYSSKHGEIYYTKQGKGAPLLLVHNLDTTSSSYEWSKIIKRLEKKYTIYTLDLLGCGQSDKPSLTYSNYMYVQIITEFVKNIIGKKTSVVASADASSIIIMANHMDETLFHKIIMINPPDINSMKMKTTNLQMLKKNILFTPLIGTSLYNFYVREEHIKIVFRNELFSKKNADISRYVDTYYQAAHINNSNGRYLYASKLCGYTNIDISIGLKEKDNMFILSGTDRKRGVTIVDAYTNINDNIDVTYISNSKMLPQLEVPEQCTNAILAFLDEDNKESAS